MNRLTPHYGQRLAVIGAAVCLTACAQFDPNAAFREVQAAVGQRAGQQPVWLRDAPGREAAARLCAELSREPVGIDAAVHLALLNNASLQAAYAELGGAEAQAVQSSLLANPFLHAAVQTPREPGLRALDFALSWDVLGLLTLPQRQEAATHDRTLARLSAAARTLELATRTRAAWFEHQAAREIARLAAERREADALVAEIARRRHAAGNQAGLTQARTQVASLESAHLDAEAQAEVEATRRRLLELIGLTDLRLADNPADLPLADPPRPDADELEARHLDLVRLKAELAQATRQAGRSTWAGDLELGWAWSRETSGAWQDGPSLGIALPLIDTGALRSAAAGFARERLQATLAARRRGLLHEALDAEAEMKRARARVESLRNAVLPLLAQARDSALLEYNAMHRDAAGLLELKRRELDARQQQVQSLDAYWQARTTLEALHLGVSLHPAVQRPSLAGMSADSAGGH